MRIAVLPPVVDGYGTALENYFHLHALEVLLSEHELVRFQSADPLALECDLRICFGNRFLEDGFWDEWILGKQCKTAVMGLNLEPDFKLTSRHVEKLRTLAKSGGIGVADEVTQRKVKEAIHSTSIYLSGNIGLFANAEKFALSKATTLFIPASWDPAFTGKHRAAFRRLQRRVFRRMNRKHRSLFFVHNMSEFDFGAVPGRETLFEPRHPALHLKALASASAVVGAHPTSLMVAISSGVPAVLVGNFKASKNLAESAGVPFLEINPNTDPGELEHRAEEVIRKYPWETVKEKSGRLREAMVAQLKELGLRPRETKRRTGPSAEPKQTIHIASILGSDDLPAFLGLYENLREFNALEVHHHVLALDRQTEINVEKVFVNQHVYLYRPSEVWQETDISGLLGPESQRKFLLTPRFLSVLASKGESVLFCSPRIHFTQSPAHWLEAIGSGHTLLFPRWQDAPPWPEASGLFHAEALVVSSGSQPFLQWWARTSLECLENSPTAAPPQAPALLNLSPVLFKGIEVYPRADHVVGQCAERALQLNLPAWDGELWTLRDGLPVRSTLLDQADAAGMYALKVVWDQLAHFYAGLPVSGAKTSHAQWTLRQQQTFWNDLSDFMSFLHLWNTHLPWFAHAPGPFELRFFVHRGGRWLIRLLSAFARAGRSPAVETASMLPKEATDPRWIQGLQERLFTTSQQTATQPAKPVRSGSSYPAATASN